MTTANGSVKGSELCGALLDAAQRTAARRQVRTCRDCGEPNPPLRTYSDPDYCRVCVGAHVRRCTTCTTSFVRDGVNTDCPSCREQLALFSDGPAVSS